MKASAATVRLRLYDVLALLPPETYEGILAVLYPQGLHCSKIMKLPQSLPLQIAERLLELS